MITDEQFHDEFQNTEEMLAWDDFCMAARTAIDEGKKTAELPTAFLALALPELRSDPLHFAALRAVWNRLCDEKGFPQEKLEPRGETGGEFTF